MAAQSSTPTKEIEPPKVEKKLTYFNKDNRWPRTKKSLAVGKTRDDQVPQIASHAVTHFMGSRIGFISSVY